MKASAFLVALRQEYEHPALCRTGPKAGCLNNSQRSAKKPCFGR
jgi:hypothetical protein